MSGRNCQPELLSLSYSGQLEKRSHGFMKGWSAKWVCLRKGCLTYFDKKPKNDEEEQTLNPRSTYPLVNCTVRPSRDTADRPHAFVVSGEHIKHGEITLACDSKQVRNDWIERLSCFQGQKDSKAWHSASRDIPVGVDYGSDLKAKELLAALAKSSGFALLKNEAVVYHCPAQATGVKWKDQCANCTVVTAMRVCVFAGGALQAMPLPRTEIAHAHIEPSSPTITVFLFGGRHVTLFFSSTAVAQYICDALAAGASRRKFLSSSFNPRVWRWPTFAHALSQFEHKSSGQGSGRGHMDASSARRNSTQRQKLGRTSVTSFVDTTPSGLVDLVINYSDPDVRVLVLHDPAPGRRRVPLVLATTPVKSMDYSHLYGKEWELVVSPYSGATEQVSLCV
jgi:hypothetical protein